MCFVGFRVLGFRASLGQTGLVFGVLSFRVQDYCWLSRNKAVENIEQMVSFSNFTDRDCFRDPCLHF